MISRSIIILALIAASSLSSNTVDAFARGSTNVARRTTIATVSSSTTTSLNAAAAKKAPKKEAVESVRKKEFVAAMAEELGYSKTDAESALSCVLELITGVSTVYTSGYDVCVFICAEYLCRQQQHRK